MKWRLKQKLHYFFVYLQSFEFLSELEFFKPGDVGVDESAGQSVSPHVTFSGFVDKQWNQNRGIELDVVPTPKKNISEMLKHTCLDDKKFHYAASICFDKAVH